MSGTLHVGHVGAEAASEVHRLTQLAFGGYTWLRPPSGALRETEDDVRQDLALHGGALARGDGVAVGALRLVVEPLHIVVRRVAVLPERQGTGIGHALMEWAHRHAAALGLDRVRVGVRAQLPANRAFYERLGYRVVRTHLYPGSREPHWYEMEVPVAGAPPRDRGAGAGS